jgi:hypothetical protein
VWLDVDALQPGDDWDTQIGDAIRECQGLLFLMTQDSVRDDSVCKNEWRWALKYKKPIIPLRFESTAELPFRLASPSSDFRGNLRPNLFKPPVRRDCIQPSGGLEDPTRIG